MMDAACLAAVAGYLFSRSMQPSVRQASEGSKQVFTCQEISMTAEPVCCLVTDRLAEHRAPDHF